ncbi:low molecular weight phosphotyrosine protein phosphatase [Mucilaginibacter roseus]|uniref:protein-tyrosine-phosphatase n=1 Tax=Mucilaginibacter roseus TaxID=1528868 RepID=A0ABS8U7Q5_9SPHI|nr:low molecular weight protein-tyrosine-phosphatase [Mucilaginibacter roseus]MCD8742265.1 low molecular weight phosphotyrosine protein phosphatase [Mucilaginibacter roseus]
MKILMVCLGNICRSPLAEGVMQHLADKNGLDWTVDSAGTGNWHVGEAPDHRSIRTALNRGVDISKQVCKQFTVHDFDEFDLIMVMDKFNLRDVLAKARNQSDRDKVRLLLGNAEVPDPYYDDSKFETVYDMVEQGCRDIIKEFTGIDLKK